MRCYLTTEYWCNKTQQNQQNWSILVKETYAMLFNDWILVQQNLMKLNKTNKTNKTEVFK